MCSVGTGLSLIQKDLQVLASVYSMSKEYRKSGYACTDDKLVDPLLGSAETRFSTVCAYLKDATDVALGPAVIQILKGDDSTRSRSDSDQARVALVEFDIPALGGWTRLVVKSTDKTLGVSDRSSRERGYRIKIFKDRAISVVCVNFLSFSRGVQDYWVASYGNFSCKNKKSWKNGVMDLRASGTTCSARDRDPTMVTVQDFVSDATGLGDWCENLEKYGADAVDLRMVLAMLFLNMQIAKESCAFEHADLHLENVLVRSLPHEETRSLLYASSVYSFRVRFVPVLIDYDMSMSSVPYDMGTILLGRKAEDEFFYGEFTLPGVDVLGILGGVVDETAHADDSAGFPFRNMVKDALGRRAIEDYSGDDSLLTFITSARGGASPKRARKRWAKTQMCDALNEFLFMHPVDFARNLLPGCGDRATETASRYYAPSADIPPARSSVDFWAGPGKDALYAFCAEEDCADARVVRRCAASVHRVPDQYTMEDVLVKEASRGRQQVRARKRHVMIDETVLGPMAEWDAYFLLRHLQLDLQCCPRLLDFAPERLREMASAATHVSTADHVDAFRKAWSVMMYQRYTVSFDHVTIN